jgi:hypothetical protein
MTENVRDQMIASFEKTFDLPAMLAARGFVVPTTERDPIHVEMTQPSTGETLLLRKELGSGAWSYQNALDPADRGQASDYIEKRDRVSRSESLDRLIGYATERNFSPDATAYRRARQHKDPALQEAEQRHTVALLQEKAAQRLLREYGVQPSQLESGRFGQFRTPSDLNRLITEPQGLAASAFRPTDKKLVFTERPLDAIGYEGAAGKDRACYMYTGSKPSPETLRKIAHVVAELPPGMTVVLAFGRDEAGRELAERLRTLAPGLKMERESPQFGARWGDQMQAEQRHARSLQRSSSRDLSR